MTTLPLPPAHDRDAARVWVDTRLDGLHAGDGTASSTFRGGQTAADAALAALDIAGYASSRNHVLPVARRGASMMSPYVRHGLIDLPTLWDVVASAPARDRRKYRDELLWQEYARHWYARLGTRTARPLRYTQPPGGGDGEPWPRGMACIDATVGELEADGWLVNQTRMWLASDWAVRHGADWREGEDRFFRHLLDGSRAANRLGWQWTVGTGSSKAYGFSRWQVEKRAPELCRGCPLASDCPIQGWPDTDGRSRVDPPPELRRDQDLDRTAGPAVPVVEEEPETVWLTAESLGDDDPALAAHADLPAVFVFDAPLLTRLQLSTKRLVFLVETLADLAERRDVEVHVADPLEALRGRRLAATFTPVPGWRRRASELDVVATHPWRWLARPHDRSVTSFSAWRKAAGV